MENEIKIEMPKFAIIRYVGLQAGTPCIWAEVNPEDEIHEKNFYVFGTGHPISSEEGKFKYIATFQQDVFAWHLYE